MAPMSGDQIWLLHLSDFHFGSGVEYLLCQALLDAVSQAQELLGCPETELIVAVSGDLTQNGTSEEFGLAYRSSLLFRNLSKCV